MSSPLSDPICFHLPSQLHDAVSLEDSALALGTVSTAFTTTHAYTLNDLYLTTLMHLISDPD